MIDAQQAALRRILSGWKRHKTNEIIVLSEFPSLRHCSQMLGVEHWRVRKQRITPTDQHICHVPFGNCLIF